MIISIYHILMLIVFFFCGGARICVACQKRHAIELLLEIEHTPKKHEIDALRVDRMSFPLRQSSVIGHPVWRHTAIGHGSKVFVGSSSGRLRGGFLIYDHLT